MSGMARTAARNASRSVPPKELPAQHHRRDPLGVVDVGEWIGIEQDEVGHFARRDRPHRVRHPEPLGGFSRRARERLHRAHAHRIDEESQLLVQRKTGEDVQDRARPNRP